MIGTPFPATPGEVVALTIQEFTCNLDVDNAPSLDDVCNRFVDDTNRALVWVIRFKALQAWSARVEINEWLGLGPRNSRRACEAAASFRLNRDWGFDAQEFRSAIESMIARP